MRCYMHECCGPDDSGSIGAWYVAHHARLAGHQVDILDRPAAGYDAELISVHHCTDYARLAALPRRAPVRIVGGHPLQSNPRPAIPYADALCIGEAESWIGPALEALERSGGDVSALAEMPGTIVSSKWRAGDPVPPANYERPLPDNPPYLNRPGTLSAAWYVEIARGCPYSCAFCELGHSSPFRLYRSDHLRSVLNQADTAITRKINFYAPDEASHPDYHELLQYLRSKGYAASFSSMRVDSVLRHGLPDILPNHLIRVGIDGMSESIRRRVNKPITDDQIVEYVERLVARGHVQFKMFFIFSYPWETEDDFAAFEHLMRRILGVRLLKNVHLRLKWTPFIPQTCTPLGTEKVSYNFDTARKILSWHGYYARPRTDPGWYVENDGMMAMRTHAQQVTLSTGDERVLLRMPKSLPPLHPAAAR